MSDIVDKLIVIRDVKMDRICVGLPHPRDERITFDEESHTYTWDGDRKKMSATSFVAMFYDKFDEETTIQNIVSRELYPTDKYYGMTAEQIADLWAELRETGSRLGSLLHAQIEDFYVKGEIPGEPIDGWDNFVQFEEELDKERYIPYRAEWCIYSEISGVPGMIDMIYYDKQNDSYVVCDWKRCKCISDATFQQEYMYPPVNSVKASTLGKYTLQVNYYTWVLEKHYGLNVTEICVVNVHPNRPTYETFVIEKQSELVDKMVQVLEPNHKTLTQVETTLKQGEQFLLAKGWAIKGLEETSG